MIYAQEQTNDLIQGLIDGSIVLRAFRRTKYGTYEPDHIEAEFSVLPIGVRYKKHTLLDIKKVIFNDPATIVFWKDGTKTVVKCGENDIFDPEKGIAMAIAKKALGNKGNYYNEIKKWLPDIEEHYAVADKITTDTVFAKSYASDLPDKVESLKQSLKKLGDLIAGNGSD